MQCAEVILLSRLFVSPLPFYFFSPLRHSLTAQWRSLPRVKTDHGQKLPFLGHFDDFVAIYQQKPRVRKIVCPQFWGQKWLRQFYGGLEKMRPFCRKNHVHKIPRFRGGGYFGFGGGGGECRFYFYGREDFSESKRPFTGVSPGLNPKKFTRYATTPNPKAGLRLQRSSARRQPVVQAQSLVVQVLLCGNSSEKAPYYREKGPGVQGKRWPKKIQILLFLP